MDAIAFCVGGILAGVIGILWFLVVSARHLRDINITLESIVASQESTYYWVKKMANSVEEGG